MVSKSENSDSKDGAPQGGVPAKFTKIVADMNLVKGNINFTNEIIDQADPEAILNGDDDTLPDLIRTLSKLKPKLVSMIGGRIDHEAILSICLTINDDLDKTMERYKALKKGRKPLKFVPGESSLTGDSALFLNPSHIYV